jgi:hypothetical protein
MSPAFSYSLDRREFIVALESEIKAVLSGFFLKYFLHDFACFTKTMEIMIELIA